MRRASHEFMRSLAQPVTYLGLAMLVVIYGTLAYFLVAERSEALDQAENRTRSIVRILDQSFSQTLDRIDTSLLSLRRSYRQESANFDLAAWVRDLSISNEWAFRHVVARADGRIVHSSDSSALIGTDHSDRAYVRVQAGSTEDKVFVSAPFMTTSNGRWAIVMSRRINAPDGTFAGVVAALLDPAQLGQQISPVDVGRAGGVVLFGLDGFVRARAIDGAFTPNTLGARLPPDAIVLQHAKRASAGSFWAAPTAFDKITRLVSYRVIEPFALIVTVGLSEAEIYRHADRRAKIYWGVAVLLTAGVLIAIALGARREQRLIETTAQMERGRLALLQSQERHRLIEETVYDAIWDWNMLTGDHYRSPRWGEILGYANGELPSGRSTFHELVHPDDRANVANAQSARLSDDRPHAVDYRLRCKDGRYRWVHSRGKALRDADGRPYRMIGTITDISSQKIAEAEIKESHDNLARAEAMALLGHYKYDGTSDVLTWSDGTYRIFGKSRQNFTPRRDSVLDLIHPDDRPTLLQRRQQALHGANLLPYTLRVIRDDGSVIEIESWSQPLYAEDGSVTGYFGTIQDITLRRQIEAALARANRELEQRVAERTQALAQEMRGREEAQAALAQAQKMDAIGQLTAGIAHDFNNLLAVIAGSLEFVEAAAARGITAEPELIDAAVRATRRGIELVQRLLAFSRQSPLEAAPTPVDQLVVDTLRLLQRSLGESIEIVTRLNAANAAVLIDRSFLTSALVNLALNARDAMPDGGTLTIATMCQQAQAPIPDDATASASTQPRVDAMVCIVVSDTGIGMTDEVRNRAIEPFFTTKPDGLGSGLGLSMTHGFVRQSGGTLEIDSEVGRGTTITIRLPRIAPADQPVAANAIGTTAGGDKKVLLVEDDPDVRILIAAQLKQLGYQVHPVSNGNEAIDMIESPATLDITLTDVVLPGGIDGVALVKEAMRKRPTMGVLCMSGYAPTRRHCEWLRIQNIPLLEKPFSSARLAQALESVLAQAGQ